MKVLAVDCYSTGDSHLHFNATVVEGICASPNVSWVGFCGERNHISRVGGLLGGRIEQRLRLFPVDSAQSISNDKARTAFQFLNGYRKTLGVIRRERPDRIVFLAVDYTVWPLFVLACLSRYNARHKSSLYVILHDLFRLKISHVKRAIWDMMFKRVDVGCIVLAAIVQDKFREIFPNRSSSLWRPPSYEHLIGSMLDNSEEGGLEDKVNDDEVIRLLLVGRWARIAISCGFLERLATKCGEITRTTGKEFEITVASANSPQCDQSFLRSRITWVSRRLSDQEYFQTIARADYVVFPPASNAAYQISNVLIDAITMETPVLAPNVGHFKDMISSDGAGGWLYGGEGQIESVLYKLATVQQEEYLLMQDYIRKKKEELSLNAMAPKLHSILRIKAVSGGIKD